MSARMVGIRGEHGSAQVEDPVKSFTGVPRADGRDVLHIAIVE